MHSFEYCLRDFALSLIALENLNIQPKISKKGQLVIGFNMLHRSFILSFLFFTLLHVSMAGRYIYECKRHVFQIDKQIYMQKILIDQF